MQHGRGGDADFQTVNLTVIRYEPARRYGVHAGVDVAWGPDDVAIYVQFGNAWMWE